MFVSLEMKARRVDGAGATVVAIIENGSTPRERVTHAAREDISRIADETGVKPPAVIVIGRLALEGFLASETAATVRP